MCADGVHVPALHTSAVLLAADGPAVTSFTLYNADNEQPVAGFESLTGGTVELNLSTLPPNLTIVANTNPSSVGSVGFQYDSTTRTENTSLYALGGGTDADLALFNFTTGTHSLTATPYTGSKLTGDAGSPLNLQLVVKRDSTTTTVKGSSSFSWTAKANLPLARYESEGASVDGNLYVFGGFYNTSVQATKRVDVYDVSADQWTRLADMPEAITHGGIAAVGHTIYVAGGFVGNNPGPSTAHVWKYDIDSNTWSRGVNLPADRAGGGLVVLGNELHYFGGGRRTNTASNDIPSDYGTHWALNLDDGADAVWNSRASMPNPRNHIGSAVVNGKAYAVGGQHHGDETSGNEKEVDEYNPATDSWTRKADMPRGAGHISTSTFSMDGRVIVMGGVTTNKVALANAIAFDPASNNWSALPNLPATRKSPVANVVDGKIVVTGGSVEKSYVQATTWTGTLTNKWYKGANLPVNLGEVAAGIVNGKMYMVGEGSSSTYAYDLASNTWTSGLKARTYAGHHHAAEVLNGKLYLFGGLSAGQGKVQIYNPSTNSWSAGASMPFAAGAGSTALIGGKVYYAGGIVGTSTTDKAAVYDPASNSWSSIASMPQGVNHAASSTDGSRLYVFGGRGGGNTPSNGYTTVQIYDPSTDQWTSSLDPADNIAPLPQARGGMGRAVYANGSFYVLGGETATGSGATANKVYDRVDVYNPILGIWTAGNSLPTARHGIYPLLHNGRILVAGGGIKAGNSQTNLLEILYLG